jgi:preprotein translocase subunit SecB
MKPAPVNLLEYFVTDLALSANPEFAADRSIETKEGDFDVRVRQQPAPREADDHRWQVTLEIIHQAAQGTNAPYAFRVVMVGFFKAEASVKPEDEERMVRIQGASVLYGMGREIVRAMTGRGPHRPVILPTVSFYEQKPDAVPPGISKRQTPKAAKRAKPKESTP